LKKNEKAAQLQQTHESQAPATSLPTPHQQLDSDEDELMNLLDEIGHIDPPTIMPTQKPVFSSRVTESLSSDLFDGIDEALSVLPALQTLPIGNHTQIDQSILTRSRPALGTSPTAVTPIVPQGPANNERLPYPILPDGFTPELFSRNLAALLPLLPDISTIIRTPLLQISSIDRLSKVHLAVGMITSIEQPTGRDYLVIVSDETGSVALTVHEQVLRETRKRLHYGMMMVLTDTSIFRPTPKSQCLIVVPRNVRYLISNVFNSL
jgi:hypothetical protein